MELRYRHWSFWVVILIPLAIATKDGTLESTMGTCANEGEPVENNLTAAVKGCYFCKCKNGYVQCDSKCPSIETCHLITMNSCCKLCKGCIYKGRSYLSDTEWIDPSDPCKVMRCEAAIVTVSELHCYTPCSNPLPPEPGKCCRTCPDCQINGQTVAENRDVVTENDPCLKCRCSKGQLTCSKKACPVLQCVESLQHRDAGECCPKCVNRRTIIIPENICPIQKRLLREREPLALDSCTDCICTNSTTICTRETCPILDCPPENQVHAQRTCCPICNNRFNLQIGEMNSECLYAGITYENGEVWKLNECSSCKCTMGRVSCARTRCNYTCESGMKTVHHKGDCCPKCIENDGACMAFGDPHYKTFDGKIYTFRGIGKYQFIEDCQDHTFSIKVANEVSQKYMDSAITKRVTVNFGDVRLNLQQRMRVKYNRRRITLPFKKEGQFRVKKEGNIIEVLLQNNVVILWNGKSFLEVTVPPNYKGKLCGLCGNFNGDVQDDLRTRTGKVVNDTDLLSFGSSWCMGNKTVCNTKVKFNYSKKSQKETRGCHYLDNERIFSDCKPKLSNSRYVKACKIDMDRCVHGKCYCESLMAYARECERLGVEVPDWQSFLKCDPQSSRRTSTIHHRPPKLSKNYSSQSSSSEELLHRYMPGIKSSPMRSRKPFPLT